MNWIKGDVPYMLHHFFHLLSSHSPLRIVAFAQYLNNIISSIIPTHKPIFDLRIWNHTSLLSKDFVTIS